MNRIVRIYARSRDIVEKKNTTSTKEESDKKARSRVEEADGVEKTRRG